jgi:hypothetical protein
MRIGQEWMKKEEGGSQGGCCSREDQLCRCCCFVCAASAAAFDAGDGSLSPFLGFSFRLLSKQVQIYCYLRQLLCPVVSLFFFVFFELVLSI